MRLTRSRKILATGAGLLGIVLGAAGIAAAATGSGGTAHRSPAVHTQETADPKEPAEANDAPDVNEQGDHDKSDGAEYEDAGTDTGETDGQG